jgi:hypothetical protein
MKTLRPKLIILVAATFILACCKKDDQSERFKLLTGHIWESDSLLVDGADASGPGGVLEKFKGDAVFRADGTGDFGLYSGTWYFYDNERNITIASDSLRFPLTSRIVELTETSLKITTSFPSPVPGVNFAIRITFIPK